MAHVILMSKLQSQSVLTSMAVDGGFVDTGAIVALEGVWGGVEGERSEIDGTINAATVAENKPHYGLHYSAMRHSGEQHKYSQRGGFDLYLLS
jgi:hypothetical protein